MHLIQLFLPLYDQEGASLPRHLFREVRAELLAKFGGLTTHARAPAEGLWTDEAEGQRVVRDDIVIYEVMTQELTRGWWTHYKQVLCERFGQKEIVIRAQPCELL